MNFPSLAFQTRTILACFFGGKGGRREPGEGLMALSQQKMGAQVVESDMVLTLGMIIEAR
jgi:hypothetical protein